MLEKSFRINNVIDSSSPLYYGNTNDNYTHYPYENVFYLDAQNYNKFEVVSLVSVRFHDIYLNSGTFSNGYVTF
jgi:hypothetical protein